MATTIDYASDYENPSATIFHGMNDYGKGSSDYQTTMGENPAEPSDYDSLTRGKLCPICVAALTIAGYTRADEHLAKCGLRCAWWDADKERCAVLSMARNK